MVDADDMIEEETALKLRRFLEENADHYSLITLPYQVTGNAAMIPRLWKRELGLKYRSPIHEYLDLTDITNDMVANPDLPIVHGKQIDEFISGFERNIRILKKAIQKTPDDLRILYHLVHDNKVLGNLEEAVEWAEIFEKKAGQPPELLAKVPDTQGPVPCEPGKHG